MAITLRGTKNAPLTQAELDANFTTLEDSIDAVDTSLGTMAAQNATSVNIDGGSIDNTTIGATSPDNGDFISLTATVPSFGVSTPLIISNSEGAGNGSQIKLQAVFLRNIIPDGIFSIGPSGVNWLSLNATAATLLAGANLVMSAGGSVDGAALGANTAVTTINTSGFVGVDTNTFLPWTNGESVIQIGDTSGIRSNPSGVAYTGNAYKDSGGWKYSSTAAASRILISGGAVQMAGAVSGTVDTAITWANGLIVSSTGGVQMPNLPTSAAGLSAGDLWNNSGVVTIV